MYNFFKSVFVSTAAWIWAVLGPALPMATACTAMVLADVWSARRLASRLGDKHPSARQNLKFSSARFSRVIRTLVKVYAALALAALVESVVVGEWMHLLRFVAAIICFWQAVSIVENEASCNSHPWARVLGRFLVDKTSRYIGKDDMPPFE